MGQRKVRCSFCGAKNTDPTVDRCRICGGVLPDAHERRKSVEAGENFKIIVEGEVETWREYKAGRFESTGKSRRPAELPPVHTQTAVPGQEMAPAPDASLAPPPRSMPDADAPGLEGTARLGRLRRLFSS